MKELFNDNWKFSRLAVENKTDAEGKNIFYTPDDFYGKESQEYESVEIPHDYLIGNTHALYENSVGFYKKDFQLKKENSKRYFLRFGGVYMNWALYVNGKKAGEWKYGYTTVEFEITDFVNDGNNSLEVICVYQCPNSRWYSGAGIFRDIYFITTEKSRIASDGIYFVSRAEEKENGKWNISVSTEIENYEEGMTVCHILTDDEGNELELQEVSCCKKTGENNLVTDEQKFTALNPKLWSTESPDFYTLTTELMYNGKVLDIVNQNAGFKTVVLDKDKGLFINGKHVKLNGVCEHHDFGCLGAAFNITALRRKFEKLKSMGVNAIRTSHNPQDEAFHDLADSMGFLIDNECFDMWEKPKTTYDYGNYFIQWHERDCSKWVRRDRNHPSLLMWSIGNEIYDTHEGNGYEITKDLKRIVREHDPEKNGAVTIGSNYMEWNGAQHCAEEIDAAGYNYGERLYEDHHKRHADWCIYGSETASTVQSRNIYHFPLSNRLLTYSDLQCSCLGNCSTNWGARSSSVVVTKDKNTEYSMGQFIWTGFDYIGEPTPYSTKNSYFGQIDTAGFEKDTFYAYKAGWSKCEPFVHVYPYWDFNEGQLVDVRCFTNGSEAELFVNGKSFGRKKVDLNSEKDLSPAWENVPYHKGKIEVVAYDEKGNKISSQCRKSFGNSDSIRMENEKYSEEELYFIDLSTVDENDFPVENSRSRIFITVEGKDAVLLGMDNGDSTDFEQYVSADGKTHNRKLFGNKLLAVIKSPEGNFTVKAESEGLNGASMEFKNGKVFQTSITGRGKIKGDVPVRKIQLECDGVQKLSKENAAVKVRAHVYPENATDKKLSWIPMMLEGVKSDCAELEEVPGTEGKEIIVKGISDGSFRLTCSAENSSGHSEIISELEFTVEGMGRAVRNPYKLIEACKCSESLLPVELSFDGGAFTHNERSWFSFDRVDFGKEGSDTVTIPIFSFDTELPVEIWDGNPDKGGKKLFDGKYRSPSVYNTYQSNTYVLSERLFGLHTVTLQFKTGLSVQGFKFEESRKAVSKLRALDCNSITGDSFTKTDDAVTGIGNNVVLQFNDMDFGEEAAASLTICGFPHVHNTIHVKFSGENGDANRIVEFDEAEGYVERTFPVEGLKGKNTVSFVFLPGSSFDFQWFKFNK